MDFPEVLKQLSSTGSVTKSQAKSLFDALTSDQATDAQIGAYLFSTSTRTISADELSGACDSLRAKMLSPWKSLPERVLDTCGTGGSGFNTFNTSTAVSFITAAAGIPTCKHGNRSRTSKSGSADVLEALGVNLDASAEISEDSLKKTNWCFLFAPGYHPATKRVQMIRKELGVRTIFNFLGPLLNPMSATHQLIGVSSKEVLPVIANALADLGIKRALVVRGEDGLDEISAASETIVYEVNQGKLVNYILTPEQFGFSRKSLDELSGSEPTRAAERLVSILEGKDDPCRELVMLNAGAALYAAEESESIKAGVELAEKLCASGQAASKLKECQS